jgi:hypothetical protein
LKIDSAQDFFSDGADDVLADSVAVFSVLAGDSVGVPDSEDFSSL